MKKCISYAFCRGFLFLALLLGIGAAAVNLSAQTLSPAQERLVEGIELYRQGKWREAVLEFRRVQAEASSADLRGEALFWIGLSQLFAGEYEEALRDMDALREAAPNHRRVRELPYHRGRTLYYLGRYDEAIVGLMAYADSFRPGPAGVLSHEDSANKAAALFWTGECLFAMGQFDRAEDIFTIITEEYRGSSKFEASTYRLALINQKRIENELLGLLRWSHEEALRNTEEFQRKETFYDQALSSYQRRMNEMLGVSDSYRDERIHHLERENTVFRDQLGAAEERIRTLEHSLIESMVSLEHLRESYNNERLHSLRISAEELERMILGEH